MVVHSIVFTIINTVVKSAFCFPQSKCWLPLFSPLLSLSLPSLFSFYEEVLKGMEADNAKEEDEEACNPSSPGIHEDEAPLFQGDDSHETVYLSPEVMSSILEDDEKESQKKDNNNIKENEEEKEVTQGDDIGEEFLDPRGPHASSTTTRTLYMLYTSSLLSAWSDRYLFF